MKIKTKNTSNRNSYYTATSTVFIFLKMRAWGLLVSFAVFFIAPLQAASQEEPKLKVIPEDMLNCTVCHGTMFQGNQGTSAPNLLGLPQWYLEGQLLAFKAQWRGTHSDDHSGSEMYAVANKLSDAEIKTYSQYIAALPSVKPATKTKLQGDIKKGEQAYQNCAACHGVNAEGNASLKAPPLNTQGLWYLKTQITNFQNGQRGYKKGDTHGTVMANASAVLTSEEDIDNVLSYIASLKFQ